MMIIRNVGFDRFRAICLPMKSHASASSSRSYGICVVVWIVAFCLNIPFFYLWVSMIAMYYNAIYSNSFDGAPHNNIHIHMHMCNIYIYIYIYMDVQWLVTIQKVVR